jgi:hypothetical protein
VSEPTGIEALRGRTAPSLTTFYAGLRMNMSMLVGQSDPDG